MCGAHACASVRVGAYFLFLIANIVVDKTGVTVTSTIWLISPNAAIMRGKRQIGLVAGSPVLSTTERFIGTGDSLLTVIFSNS